jgi:2',3'-cyclic-nucleotide 2'-phosphodiesterase (5'-nucleotidase family)
VATLVRELRRQTPHTLFALAGDTLSPSLLSTLRQGAQMIEGWNAVGLDVATFGNHEFDFGAPVLAERVRESRFPWLSANVLDRASLEAACDAIHAKWGPVEILVNGAGGNSPKATSPLETRARISSASRSRSTTATPG